MFLLAFVDACLSHERAVFLRSPSLRTPRDVFTRVRVVGGAVFCSKVLATLVDVDRMGLCVSIILTILCVATSAETASVFLSAARRFAEVDEVDKKALITTADDLNNLEGDLNNMEGGHLAEGEVRNALGDGHCSTFCVVAAHGVRANKAVDGQPSGFATNVEDVKLQEERVPQ